MVEIGGHPILWHIMHHYAYFGISEFVVAVGYRGSQIKSYLTNFSTANRDIRIRLASGEVEVLSREADENWVVDVIDTGISTETGGRIRRLGSSLRNETFMVTFGDSVSDVNITELVATHQKHGRLATVTAVHPPARFGELRLDGNEVIEFSEKPIESGWIIGGYMVMEPGVLEYIDGDDTALSPEPMERLAKDGQLTAYLHTGFWQGIDTLRDKILLENLWEHGSPPWRIWS